MLTLTISDVLKLKRRKTTIDEYAIKYKVGHPYKDKFRRYITLFNETLLSELIYNNQIYHLPLGFGYMFIAERYYESSKYGKTALMILMSPRGKHKLRGKDIIPILSKKWKKILEDEVKNGHRYDNMQQVIENIYGKFNG